MPDSPKLSEAQTFHLEEYKALRKEAEINMTESRAEERYLVIAVGFIWGWLILNHKPQWLLWSIPLLLSAASLCRLLALNNTIQGLGAYLHKLESHFHTLGWEHQLATSREKKERAGSFRARVTIGWTNFIISIALIIIALVGLADRVNLAAAPDPCKTEQQTAPSVQTQHP